LTSLGSTEVTVNLAQNGHGRRVRSNRVLQFNYEARTRGADMVVQDSRPFAALAAYTSALFGSPASYTVHVDFYRENQP